MNQGGIAIPANNMVHLTSNGVILMLITGQQTKDSIAELIADLAVAIKKQHTNHKPALVLADLDHMVHSPKAEEAAEEALKLLALPFDAIAVCNSNANGVKLSHKLTEKMNKEHVRSFSTAKDAARWLAERMAKV